MFFLYQKNFSTFFTSAVRYFPVVLGAHLGSKYDRKLFFKKSRILILANTCSFDESATLEAWKIKFTPEFQFHPAEY